MATVGDPPWGNKTLYDIVVDVATEAGTESTA